MTTIMNPVAVPTSAPATHPFTCNTCQVAFKSSEGQRNHMHTDWHRYNLKRRITELAPISSEVFAEKVLSSQAEARRERDRASFEKACQACSRIYYSQNAYDNHINSLKHKQRLAALQKAGLQETESVTSSPFSMGDPEESTEVDKSTLEENDKQAKEELSLLVRHLKVSESGGTPAQVQAPTDERESPSLPVTECLFCGQAASSLQQNLEHMTKLHGLFIPEQSYLVNLEGLIRYLGQKVLIGNTCLYCNKIKGGLDGVRTHMRDKGHCMIAFETEDEMLEIGEFYDFRSTYDDDEEEWEDEEGNKSKGHDGIWETDSEASSVDSEEIGPVRVSPRSSIHHRTSSSHHLEDGWHSHAHSHSHTHAVYVTETEMHLPNGRSVGHRSLARYYRQHLRDTPYADDDNHNLAIEEGDHEAPATARARPSRALTSRANGGVGLVHAPAGARSQAAKLEKRDHQTVERGRERIRARVERASNSQKHFRDPNAP